MNLESAPKTINISLTEQTAEVTPTADDPQNAVVPSTEETPVASVPSETTFDATPAATDPAIAFEAIQVIVDDNGNGTVLKVNETQATGDATDTVTSIQNFIAAEDPNQRDRITLSTDVAATFANTEALKAELSNDAVGTFTPAALNSDPISFGPDQPDTLHSLLDQRGAGEYQITAGDEAGQIGDISFSNFEDINFGVTCFARGTRILTAFGYRPVEMLKQGDRVWTCDSGCQKVIWHGTTRTRATGTAAPVFIEPGVLGNKQPLIVSQQHRILLSGPEVELYTGEHEVFVAARQLGDNIGVHIIEGGIIEYHHILLQNHEILLSDGVLTESYFPGDNSWFLLPETDRNAIAAVSPKIAQFGPMGYGDTCRPCLKQYEANILKRTVLKSRGGTKNHVADYLQKNEGRRHLIEMK